MLEDQFKCTKNKSVDFSIWSGCIKCIKNSMYNLEVINQ